MKSVQTTLQWLSDNWTMILICFGLIIGIITKTVKYFSLSKDERIKIAKAQIKVAMLKMITKAEIDYASWQKAGAVKRSSVIEEIFAKYPILSKVTDQDELIKWIDGQIDGSLVELRKIVKDNKDESINNTKEV